MDKVRQAVEIGSITDAIYTRFVDVLDILRYLIGKPVSERTLAAYRAVCKFLIPTQHYLDDKHFLSHWNPVEYQGMYITLNGDPDIPIELNKSSPKVESLLQEGYSMLRTNEMYAIRMHVVCVSTMILNPSKIASLTPDILLNRTCDYTDSSIKQYPKASFFLDSDYLLPLQRIKHLCEEDLLDRIDFLSKKAPLYWNHVASALYRRFIRNNLLNYSEGLDVSIEGLEKLKSFYPDFVEDWWLELSPEAYQVLCKPSTIRGYLLGFPIDSFDYTNDDIRQALTTLSEEGVDNYCRKIHETNIRSFSPLYPITGEASIPINGEDTLTESIFDYSPFDIFVLQKGNKCYYFTRPEFKSLLENGKNQYTNEEFSIAIMVKISCKQQTADNLQLPPSAPLREMLSIVEEDRVRGVSRRPIMTTQQINGPILRLLQEMFESD